MALTIELPTEQEKRLREESSRTGVSIDALVARAIATAFPPDDQNAAALQLIERWISEAPEDSGDAEEDLRSFQQAINQTRRDAGSRPVYSTTE